MRLSGREVSGRRDAASRKACRGVELQRNVVVAARAISRRAEALDIYTSV